MPVLIDVDITSFGIISVLNTPGGDVFNWRDRIANEIVNLCRENSPTNKRANAMHRGGVTGSFKASWRWDRVGSNGDEVKAFIENWAGHAVYVELGRGASHGYEKFSWTRHKPPGSVRSHLDGTRGRTGWHTLRDMANTVLSANTDNYTPII